MDPVLEQARTAVDAFVATDPAYSRSPEPAAQGATNRVIFGTAGAAPVVFKYFVTAERWQNELFCLQHYAGTGLVPRVLHVLPDRLLVMERLQGRDLAVEWTERGADERLMHRLSEQIGQALGKLALAPLPPPGEGYSPIRDFSSIDWQMDLRLVLSRYIARCRRIQQVLPVYRSPFFDASLALVEQQVATIHRQPQMLFHEDIGNMRVEHDEFVGFFDLEMCRLGTEAMQLGVAVSLCGPSKLSWDALRTGYEAEVGHRLREDDLISILAMNHFYCWIRVCRWGQWDGDPAANEHREASEEEAEGFLLRMKDACRTFRGTVPLAATLERLT